MENLIILDGGTGQMIEKMGFPCGKEKLWASAALQCALGLVKEVHELFAKAGSKILFSNTYNLHLNEIEDTPEKIGKLIQKNVKILQEICMRYKCTFRISVGPLAIKFYDASEYSGKYMKDGRADINDVIAHYNSILGEVYLLGIKDIAFETIPTKIEVEGVIECLKKFPDFNAFLTVVAKDEENTVGGDSLAEIAKVVANCLQIKAFGINCCNPNLCIPVSKLLAPLIRDDQSLIMKPNDGRLYLPEAECYYGTPINMTKDLSELAAHKVRYVGGCCCVGPEDIKKYVQYIEQYKLKL